uniref:Uncharacterized protein n=1 Tax=Arundo donax TaxID=35708 RepID=A0A0A9UQ76_ARUDO
MEDGEVRRRLVYLAKPRRRPVFPALF